MNIKSLINVSDKKEAMRVLMFGWEFPPNISGGLGTACYGITKGLKSYSDVEVTFVLPRSYGNEVSEGVKFISASDVELSNKSLKLLQKLGKFQTGESVTISCYMTPEQYSQKIEKKITTTGHKISNPPGSKISLSGKYGASLYDEIFRYSIVAREIAEIEDYDIIHAHDWLTFKAGIEAKRASGKPLVVHVHATEFDRCGENYNKKVFKIEQEGMMKADAVITVSRQTKNTVILKYGINPNKVHTVYNAVDPFHPQLLNSSYKKGINEKIVTFLGRVTYQKGPEFFVAAARKVLEKMQNVRFVMAGNGDLSEKMIRYVASLGISDKFHFAGFLKGEDVYRMYTLSDLYVMPSVSEPFGIAPLEAIHSGVPVIVSRQSGVSEIVNHAIKIDFWDIDGMADAIYAILNYPALTNFLKTKGKEEVNNLSWNDSAGKIRNIYSDLLTGRAS